VNTSSSPVTSCNIRSSNDAPDIAPALIDPAYHPLPQLLTLTATQILDAYRTSQAEDFKRVFEQLPPGNSCLIGSIGLLDAALSCEDRALFRQRLSMASLSGLFFELHGHVMGHPVWTHPLFERFAEGDVSFLQLRSFACHYFNQVKNTRQCVALALARFHSLIDTGRGNVGTLLSELTQGILARLVSDEYGLGPQTSLVEKPPVEFQGLRLGELFEPLSHTALYRRFLRSLDISPSDQDIPLLHAIADNVLAQRVLSGDPAYDRVEALASVGVGMEWGVPAFFSMLLSGILKVSQRYGCRLSPADLEIWSAHVQQDVEHALAVMIATAFFVDGPGDLARIKSATNVLMAFRYEMLNDIYAAVFETNCAPLDRASLSHRYICRDMRIQERIRASRSTLRPDSVTGYAAYLLREKLPDFFNPGPSRPETSRSSPLQ
jgi:hypothetical protein